jgi:nucleoside-diphosphate-sugar epimerase
MKQYTDHSQVVIVGFGDIGRKVASLLPAETDLLTLSRSTSDMPEPDSWKYYNLDLDDDSSKIPVIKPGALIFYFVPPPGKGEIDTRAQKFLSSMEAGNVKPFRVVIISTSGVYGDRKGACVSEDDAPNPQTDRARRRLDMERQFKYWCRQYESSLIILRVGSIYGPGRLPIKSIKDSVPVLSERLAPRTNRIHAGDLAKICIASSSVNHKYRIYNVSDGQEANMTEYFNKVADHFDLPRPPQISWDNAKQTLSPQMISYLHESRHMDTSRMHKELNMELDYPNLLLGLKSCVLE